MLSVLSQTDYRRLFAAQVLSLVGTGLTTVALGLLAFELAGADAGIVLGTALALKMVVYVGFSPIAEVIARRLPRKRFLVTLDVLRAGFVLLFPFVTEVWQIYALVVLFQSCSAGFTPVFQATIPDILPDEEDYTKALSLSRLAYDLESLLSPMLAGLLLGFLSFSALFVGTTLGFLASAVLVLVTTLPKAIHKGHGTFFQRLTRGTWIYLATPRLRGLLALSFAVASAGAMVIVNTVVLVQDEFGGTARQVALMFAAYGAGSMLVALSLPRLFHLLPERSVMLAGGAVLVPALCFVPFLDSLNATAALWGLMGAAASAVQVPAGLLLRRSAHAEDRPAVFAAQFALSHACWLVTYPLAGWGGAILGLSEVAVIMVFGIAASVLLAAYLWPSGDPQVLEHEHDEIEHDHGHSPSAHHRDHALEGDPSGRHRHRKLRHAHPFVIDDHHPIWPQS
ncbi:MAG: MFS transporter [Dinoroseobacter sp.]|nr:MFS transporter [Dinoroseobacter sp.]